jgi:integrase
MDLFDLVKSKRPNLNVKSIKTYSSVLNTIRKDLNIDKVKDFNNDKKILKYLEDMPVNKRKTRLSALLVLTDNENYKKQMLEDINKFNANVKEQKKSDVEKENWMSKEEINKIYDKSKKRANELYKKGTDLKISEFQTIQDFILLSLFVLNVPRRAMDYTEMKISDIDPKKDNYIKGDKMIFNIYKTSKNKGTDVLEIPKKLKSILKKWISINPTEYLLFDTKLQKLSSIKVNQRLNKIMNRPGFSVNMFRHIYLTDKYKDTMKEMKEMQKDMEDMGSSMKQATTYVKMD